MQLSMFDAPVLPIDKARAERRANVARNIRDGLIVDVAHSRNDHPDTSHEAGEALTASGARASMQRKILEFVRRFPGTTLLEITAGTGIEKHNVASRLAELKGNERTPPMVYQGDKRQHMNRKYVTWWPAER